MPLALYKGALLALPLALAAIPWVQRFLAVKTWVAIGCALIWVAAIILPFSFVGWVWDYLFLALIITPVLVRLPQRVRTWVTWCAVPLLLLFVPIKGCLGAHVVRIYERGSYVYALYETPDMVAAPQHDLKVWRRYHIFLRTVMLAKASTDLYGNWRYEPKYKQLFDDDTCVFSGMRLLPAE